MPDIVITDLRGGRNGIDSPLILPENQCCEAVNVDWEDGPLATKRRGAVQVTTTVDLGVGIASMFRHVPDGDETAAEGWFVLTNGSVYRLTTSGWGAVTLDDAITGSPYLVSFCSFNKKLFMAYGSAVNRLHVWDPDDAKVRRVGLPAPTAAPTAANTGGGTISGARYIRVRVIDYDGTTVKRRSEPSPSVAFTPSGTGAAVRVTKPTLPGEGETHWEIEVAPAANGPWFQEFGVDQGNAIVVGTSTGDDITTVGAYASYEAALDGRLALGTLTSSEATGTYTLPTSVRYLATDGNNLLMGGSYTATGKTSRIWNTPALGSADHGDDERIQITDTIKGYVDLNEKDGGALTGISPPVNGYPLAFKYRQTWRLAPTGDPNSIYIPRKISDAVGCIFFKTIVVCEDAQGNSMLAWLSHKGPWKMAPVSGLAKIGRDVDDLWFGRNGQTSKVNLHATTVVAHAIYHTDRNQIWFFVSRDSEVSPSTKFMVDLRRNVIEDVYGMRGGWALHTGKSCQAACSMMFSNTVGATMSIDLKPWVSYLASP